MDKDATKCNGSDKYNAATNESAEKEESERISMEVTEIETTVSVISDDEPDNMHTESHESTASGRGTVVLTYLQHQESFLLPSYEAEINKLLPVQETRSRGGNKKNKNENIRLTETTGRSCQPSNLERQILEATQRRIDSFVGCSYQHQLPQAVTLAEAGFYFTDDGVIRCFACGIEFRDWIEQDNIWEWHARWSTSCSHVEKEGKKYFDLQYLDLKSKKKAGP